MVWPSYRVAAYRVWELQKDSSFAPCPPQIHGVKLTESSSPSVVVPGIGTYTPPGWMWVLWFALGGCEWAIKEAGTEEFREIAREWYRQQKIDNKKRYVAKLERQLERARIELEELKGADNGTNTKT